MKRALIFGFALLLLSSLAFPLATPPALVNYQGVLLSVTGAPEDGDRDMEFHFFDDMDPALPENEILVDSHMLGGSGPVTVSKGLFNVRLGGGTVSDGTGAGVFADLSEVFRDFPEVHLEVRVRVGPAGGLGALETLSPRVRIVSAAYALNTDRLDGKSSDEFLDTSATAQIKSGLLTLSGGTLTLGATDLTEAQVMALTASDAVVDIADAQHTHNLVANATNASNAALLDGLDSLDFLRRTVSDSFMGAVLTLNTAALTDTNLTEEGIDRRSPVNQTFKIGNSDAGFVNLKVEGNLLVGDPDLIAPVNFNRFALGIGTPNASADINLRNDVWIEGDLDVNDTLYTGNSLVAADPSPTTGQAFSSFGEAAGKDEVAVSGPGDVYIANELEVDGTLFGGPQILASAGSAGVPGLGINGDPDTGVFSPGANFLSLASAGLESVRATSSTWTFGQPGVNERMGLFSSGNLAIGESLFLNCPSTNVGTCTSSQSIAFDTVDNRFEAFNDFFVQDTLQVGGRVVQGQNTAGGVFNTPLLQLTSDETVVFMMDRDNSSGSLDKFEWYHDGTIAAANKLAELLPTGNLRIRGTLSQSVVFDLAEAFLKSESMEAGDIVRVDPKRSNAVLLTAGDSDAAVLGVVSERPGVLLGGAVFGIEDLRAWGEDVVKRFEVQEPSIRARINAESPRRADPIAASRELDPNDGYRDEALRRFEEEAFAAVALSGRVPVKVDTRFGEIRVGDLLAPSPIPGVAMKATKAGTVIGTALEDFSGGRGKVPAFIHLGSYTPPDDGQLAQQIESRTPDEKTGTQTLEGNLQIVLDRGADDRSRFSVFRDGAGSLGAEVFRVDEEGNVYARGSFRPASLDLAEYQPVSEPVEVGDVVVVDRNVPGKLRKGDNASDPGVVGIVSGAPGILLGSGVSRIASVDPGLAAQLDTARAQGDRATEARLWNELEARFALTHAAIALSGTVPCKADASYGAIRVGDLLTVSPTSGHAMRSPDGAAGTIIGKALESLDAGKGVIRVLVMLR